MLVVPTVIYIFVYWACLIAGVYAFVDAATRRADAYVAVDRKTKQFWLIVLGLGVLAQIVFPAIGFGLLSILGLAGIVAAIVYLVDVRKKIIEVLRGGSRW